MNVGLYQAAAALNANSRWQDVISENLASSSVPGFKKQELSVAAVQAGLMPSSSLNSLNAPHVFSLPKAVAKTSFASGQMQFTGNKTDVAIEGKGFFQVALPNGAQVLTRNGEFQINTRGQLVTKEGYTVMAEGSPPHPIQLDPSNPAPISISNTGDISQGADSKGKLKITAFDKPQLLTQIGAGYYAADDPALHALTSVSTVRQGYLETSNTSVVTEMANMMTAMRMFEANQHVIQIQDDRMGKVISDLGNPGSS